MNSVKLRLHFFDLGTGDNRSPSVWGARRIARLQILRDLVDQCPETERNPYYLGTRNWKIG
jgi:hypothetical protein